MPEALFKTSGKGGTHAKVCVLFLENTKPVPGESWDIFMAEAKWCGHDSRGNPTIRPDENGKDVLLDDVPRVAARYREFQQGLKAAHDLIGFKTPVTALRNDVFIAKYYDPGLAERLKALRDTHELVSLEELVQRKTLSWETGLEVGKMAYGTGTIPFIRTSDISNWELKGDPKQGISEAIYEDHRQDVQAGDIFVVRDGTYLVGTSCILTEHDTKILFCGGLYKLRSRQPDKLDPFLLLALLNTPIVRRQMRAKQFTRDIIDTLGKRLFEIVLPLPKDLAARKKISDEARQVVETRVRLRQRTKEIPLEIERSFEEEDDALA